MSTPIQTKETDRVFGAKEAALGSAAPGSSPASNSLLQGGTIQLWNSNSNN